MWYADGIDVAVIAAAVATIDELVCITDVFVVTVDEADDCNIGLADCDFTLDGR